MVTLLLPASKVLAFVPEFAPCPRCGATIARNAVRRHTFTTGSLHGPEEYCVSFSCFICPDHAPGERWFTALPEDFAGYYQYTSRTRALILSLVVVHKMSLHHAADFARKHFHLAEITPSTVMRWMRDGCPTSEELAERQQDLVARFSGQLAVDEIYDGHRAIIKATDPLLGVEVAYEYVEGPVNGDVMVAFFRRLQGMGFAPLLVVTDGAAMYPGAIEAVWPTAAHQTCVFHFLQNWTKAAMKAVWHCHRLMPAPN